MAEAERAFLGLTHNPFVQPAEGFFERGDRKTHLEQLRHLSQWSRRVLLVTGPEGVGKTALYRQLAASLEPRVKAARINGALVTASREVMMAIAQGFGLAAPADANSQLLVQLITDHVAEQAEADRQCLVVIDDAHLLEPKVIDELIRLVQECALHVVLFGEVRLVPGVERSASRQGVGWHEIRLTGFGDADAREYLEWRFQQARYRGRIPFTDGQLREIVRLSDGLPGRINQMANVLLVKLESGGGEDQGGGFPRLHAAVLILLVVLIGLTWLVLVDEDEAPPPGSVATLSDEARLPGPATAEREDEPAASASERQPADIRSATQAQDSANDELAVVPLPAPRQTTQAPETRQAESPATAPPTSGAQASEAAAATGSEPAEDTAGNVQAIAAEGTVGAPEPAASEPRPVAAAAPPEEPRPQSSTTSPAGTERDSSWLLSQDPNKYTIQLVTLSSIERANAFVGKQQRPRDFAIYQLARDGRILHVVIYGLFASRAEALAAADELPPEVGNVQPWVRPMSQVQEAARLVGPS